MGSAKWLIPLGAQSGIRRRRESAKEMPPARQSAARMTDAACLLAIRVVLWDRDGHPATGDAADFDPQSFVP